MDNLPTEKLPVPKPDAPLAMRPDMLPTPPLDEVKFKDPFAQAREDRGRRLESGPQDRLSKLLVQTDELPLHIQEKAKQLIEKDEVDQHVINAFIREAKAEVPDEQKGVVEQLGRHIAGVPEQPTEVMNEIEQYVEGNKTQWNPERQQEAAEMLSMLQQLHPEVRRLEEYKEKGDEPPKRLLESLKSILAPLKKPLKFATFGIVGFILMCIVGAARTVGAMAGGRQ